MEQELKSPGDEDCPVIVEVYSLVENPQVKIEPGTQTVKDDTGKPMPPSAFLKQFQPFGETKNAVFPKTNLSQTNHEDITTDSFLFKPRTPNFTSPRLRFDPPPPPPPLRHPYTHRGIRPTSPHVLIRATQQNTTNYPNTNQTADHLQQHTCNHPSSTLQRPPLPPHQLIRQGKDIFTTPQVRATHPVVQQSSNIVKPPPPHEIIRINQFTTTNTFTRLTPPQSADHEHTRSHSYPNLLPVDRQPNPSARQHTRTVPLAPHEILQSRPTSSRAPNAPMEFSYQEQQIKQQIIKYLNTSRTQGETALKISKEINQPRKLVQEILNHQAKRSIVFITNSTQPYTYSTSNSANSGSPYSIQKRPLPSSASLSDSNNSKRIDTSAKNFNMDPVSLLAHICSRERIPLDYRLVSSLNMGGKAEMVMEVRVGDKVYTARGNNKKNAKKDVSDLALKDLLVQGEF